MFIFIWNRVHVMCIPVLDRGDKVSKICQHQPGSGWWGKDCLWGKEKRLSRVSFLALRSLFFCFCFLFVFALFCLFMPVRIAPPVKGLLENCSFLYSFIYFTYFHSFLFNPTPSLVRQRILTIDRKLATL